MLTACFIAHSGAVKGQSAFSYVGIPANATQNALGSNVISLVNSQPLSFLQNPGLLDSAQNNNLEVGISPVFGQGIYTAAGYAFQDKKKRQWAVGFRGISFGEFAGTDAVGNPTQTFGAGNALLSVAHSRKIKYIAFGVAAKIVTSFIESYNSTAFLLDVGGVFRHPEKDFTFGMTARNLGFSISRFTDVQQQLPFDLLIGTSFKPQYMPVRFTISANQLYRFESLEPQGILEKISTTQQVAGHLSGGAELLFNDKIIPMIGYNYRLSQEMSLGEENRFGGLSYGLRFQTKRFQLAASRTNYLPQIGRWIFSGSWGF
ncbi:MAG: type IX secretion system protein PorQ [Spirosomaceae bacterium]|nr:type IX secretion system protein PorQ [Spirosomataceae bacterium]